MVVGGFPRDTRRETIVAAIRRHLEENPNVIDIYAPAPRHSIGKVEWATAKDTWAFIKGRQGTKLANGDSPLWFSAEKTPEERFTSRRTSRAIAAIRAHVGDSNAAAIDGDYKAGTIWYNDTRVIESNRRSGVFSATAEWGSALPGLLASTTLETINKEDF
jgi:hypothetical protein